ncbi:uncharacterized protein LOC115416571 [Sphaeramia orbicularis]|uniref:uncharacterized protein LOC115416571 n=1 Tax=Sphaeramia orbicularis TaxID=375764 RepID=UPI00117C0835|nr:uncharacterized protein LOC115416571 [Sphaeramia orbicularis]
MQRSRRLVFVVSPDFLVEKSFSLLECRLGLYLHHGHGAAIVSVVYRSVSKLQCVEAAQLRQASVSAIKWRGGRSEPPRSRFWLRLRLALPVRPLAMGRRLIDSTSSHSDLAAMVLQRAQWIQNHGANQSHRNRRTSANQNRRDRPAPARGRGHMKRAGSGASWKEAGSTNREEGLRQSWLGGAGVRGQVGAPRGDVTIETEQQLSHDKTEIRSDPVPETDPTLNPDPTHFTPDPAPVPVLGPDSTLSTCQQEDGGKHQQQLIGSHSSEIQ